MRATVTLNVYCDHTVPILSDTCMSPRIFFTICKYNICCLKVFASVSHVPCIVVCFHLDAKYSLTEIIPIVDIDRASHTNVSARSLKVTKMSTGLPIPLSWGFLSVNLSFCEFSGIIVMEIHAIFNKPIQQSFILCLLFHQIFTPLSSSSRLDSSSRNVSKHVVKISTVDICLIITKQFNDFVFLSLGELIHDVFGYLDDSISTFFTWPHCSSVHMIIISSIVSNCLHNCRRCKRTHSNMRILISEPCTHCAWIWASNNNESSFTDFISVCPNFIHLGCKIGKISKSLIWR